MERARLLDAQAQLRRINKCLGEALDLSNQMADAVDRNDQVAVRMLMAMREEPIGGMTMAREILQEMVRTAPPEEGARLRAILNGGGAQSPEEEVLVSQAASNARLLEQLQRLDKGLNLKITRGRSFYST